MRDLILAEDAHATDMGPQPDLPPGRTARCSVCGTRLRTGQPHTAMLPHPHSVYDVVRDAPHRCKSGICFGVTR